MAAFGAQPATTNNIIDSTTAIQAAINAAEAQILMPTSAGNTGADYWSATGAPSVYLPCGLYWTSGLDIYQNERFGGDNPGCVKIALLAGSNRSVIRVHDLSGNLAVSDAGSQLEQSPWLIGFSIDGNSSQQSSTATSHGIELSDAVSPYPSYGSGAHIDHVYVNGALDHGIYIGLGRQYGVIDDVIVTGNGEDGIRLQTCDWAISNSSIGANTWNGLDFYNACAITVSNTAVYNNAGNGVNFGGIFGSYFWFTGGTISANASNGVLISLGSLTPTAMIGFANTQFTDNSAYGGSSYSQISATNTGMLMLSNVSVTYQGSGNDTKYIINNDTSGMVSVSNLTYSTATVHVPYTTAPFANPSYVSGTANGVSLGGVSCSGAPSGSYAVTNGVVTHC